MDSVSSSHRSKCRTAIARLLGRWSRCPKQPVVTQKRKGAVSCTIAARKVQDTSVPLWDAILMFYVLYLVSSTTFQIKQLTGTGFWHTHAAVQSHERFRGCNGRTAAQLHAWFQGCNGRRAAQLHAWFRGCNGCTAVCTSKDNREIFLHLPRPTVHIMFIRN